MDWRQLGSLGRKRNPLTQIASWSHELRREVIRFQNSIAQSADKKGISGQWGNEIIPLHYTRRFEKDIPHYE